MKTCTACHRLFEDAAELCPFDRGALARADEVSPPHDPKDPRVGAAVCDGRYQIWRAVAEGAMGRVYEALDRKQGRGVALKILHQEVAEDPVALARFKREFELNDKLSHEHVVEVHAFEHDAEDNYVLVMEYLEGEELRMRLDADKVLAPARVLRIVSQVALGLQPAHDQQIVHRDLKPDNVFLCASPEGDVVKLLDFGSVRDNSEGAKKLTALGTTIGSPYYMAPEQAQGLAALDHRADVWSVAAIAYEALTGKVPFEGASGPAILLNIITKPHRPPSEVGKAHGVPRTLDAVMDDALAKDPAERIPTVGALVDQIGRAYGLEGTHVAWAKTTEEALAARIDGALPELLARLAEEGGGGSDLGAMDAAFAGGGGVDMAATNPFPEDVVMGLPAERPRWLMPVIAGGILLLGALVAFLAAR
ncbi:serine/threonine-protein kinase [Polyangium aurulentum]|uniref:serine/threonine-protein kinase n=1 Tax=Polyangium aurulentum TaxID=2567896 RepID=UPI0010ADE327|nr:serine/threonine-protein kinase [Polyangium aurulentum]UQA56139.1 serine/threonine protein kinase [Polyangium aurulentum]